MIFTKFLASFTVVFSLSAAHAETGVLFVSQPESAVKNVYFGRVDRVSETISTQAHGKTREVAEANSLKLREEALAKHKQADLVSSGQGRQNIFISVVDDEAQAVSVFRHVMETSDGFTITEKFSIQSSFVVLASRPTSQTQGNAKIAMIMVATSDGLKTSEANYNMGALRLSEDGYKLKIKAGSHLREQVLSQIPGADQKKLKTRMVLIDNEANYVVFNLNEKESAEFMDFPPKRNAVSRLLSYCASMVMGSSAN